MNIFKFGLVYLIIVLATLRPSSEIDVFLSTFILGALLNFFSSIYYKSKLFIKIPTLLLTIFLVLLSYHLMANKYFFIAFISIMLGLIVAERFKVFLLKPQILAVIIILAFVISSISNSGELRRLLSKEPQSESYFNDQLAYLKTFYLVEKGNNYYSALPMAHIQDGRSDSVPQKLWEWRFPTYAYLWKIFPGTGGISIYIFFIILASIGLIFSYKIANTLIESSLSPIVPYILFPYYHFAARDVAFLHSEWWSVSFFIIGIYFLLQSKLATASLFLIVAVLLREIMVIPIIALAVVDIIFKKYNHLKYTLLVLTIFFGYYLLHFLNVDQVVPQTILSLELKSHQIGILMLNQTLAFASWEYLFTDLRLFLLSFLTLVIFMVIALIKKLLTFHLSILLIFSLSIPIAVLKIGNPPYNDYWGVAFVPLIIITTPIFIFRLIHERQKNNKQF